MNWVRKRCLTDGESTTLFWQHYQRRTIVNMGKRVRTGMKKAKHYRKSE
jgi:hypothetical protein